MLCGMTSSEQVGFAIHLPGKKTCSAFVFQCKKGAEKTEEAAAISLFPSTATPLARLYLSAQNTRAIERIILVKKVNERGVVSGCVNITTSPSPHSTKRGKRRVARHGGSHASQLTRNSSTVAAAAAAGVPKLTAGTTGPFLSTDVVPCYLDVQRRANPYGNGVPAS